MSKRNKLQKFAEIAAFDHVYENFDPGNTLLTRSGKGILMQGQWNLTHFRNDNPITLELACGKGEYTVGLAQMFPERNFIGVDVKGARIWKGAGKTLELGLANAAFLRTRIEMLAGFFGKEEVDEIWIVFPDPFPRKSKANRRLTAPHFLDIYRQVLKPKGVIHLKTDDQNLYEYTLESVQGYAGSTLLQRSDDIYQGALPTPELDIKTFYERQHLAAGKTIKYVRFSV